jgi:hypothetical protein
MALPEERKSGYRTSVAPGRADVIMDQSRLLPWPCILMKQEVFHESMGIPSPPSSETWQHVPGGARCSNKLS